MKPIAVPARVERHRDAVYAYLDVLANHEPFTDRMLVDGADAAPPAGVAATARVRANLPGPKDWIDMKVVKGRALETATIACTEASQ